MCQPFASYRAVALAMALIVAFSCFAGIDRLASSEPASPSWAAASLAQRG